MAMPEPDSPTLTAIREEYVQVPSIRLDVTAGFGAEASGIDLGVNPAVIGTSSECDLPLSDGRVSRRHCEVKLTQDGIVVKDLGSKNGTFINSVRIFEATLTPGVTLTIGNTQMVARVMGAPTTIPLSKSTRFGDAIGHSIPMRTLFAQLERVAMTPETIVLLGESGTGKGLLASGIHALSPRNAKPFVVFDCASVASTLLESELFGHVRGAFTGAIAARSGVLEQADGGTLFIDELGELPMDLQPKLLRALESRQSRRIGSNEWRTFDARVIVATHRDLRARVINGMFREDLYYRLAVMEVIVPPLRERADDIPRLVEHFLALQTPARSMGDLPANAMQLLKSHSWPGNVRELRNTLTRLVLLPHLGKDAFIPLNAREGDPSGNIAPLLKLPYREAKELMAEQFERIYVQSRLAEHGGNVSRTADSMNISRQTLYQVMGRCGIKRDDA